MWQCRQVIQILFKYIKEFTIDHINMSYVGKQLYVLVPFKCRKESTMERNLIYVSNVIKHSVVQILFK